MPTVKFVPNNKLIDLQAGTNLLAAADQSGIYLEGDCAGKGTCGKCRVRIIEGETGTPTEAEKKTSFPGGTWFRLGFSLPASG